MAGSSWDLQGEVRAALRAIVADPHLGVAALSNARTMSNLLKDFLPDTPREAGVLIAAAEADLAGSLRNYVAQGVDATTAQRIVATTFAERTALTQDACQWVVSELASAMGMAPGDHALPGGAVPGGPWTAATAAPSTAAPTNPQAPGVQQPGNAASPGEAPGWGTPIGTGQPGYGQAGYPQGQPAAATNQPGYEPGQAGHQAAAGTNQQGYGLAQQGQQAATGQPGYGPAQGQQAATGQPGYGPAQGQQAAATNQPGYGLGQAGYAPGQQAYGGAPGGYDPGGYGGQPVTFQPGSPSRRNWLIGAGAGVVVIVLIIAVVLLKTGPSAPATVVGLTTNVPASTLAAVGAGSTYSKPIHTVTGPALTAQGKPEVLYIGATFCPYCAANQWSMIIALSKFGTFTGLQPSRSATASEQYPNIATLTFRNASYSSQYLTFISVENETITKAPDQPTTAGQNTLWHRYDGGSYPFTDYGNKYVGSSLFDPGILSGLTQKQIANALSHSSKQVARAVDGSANLVIAAICQITGNQPGSVCDNATITTLEGNL